MARPANKMVEIPAPIRLATIKEYARITGDSEGAIRGRIASGAYKVGEHYHRKGKGKNCRIRLDVDACAQFFVKTK